MDIMAYFKKHTLLLISIFLFIITSIIAGFTLRASIDERELASANRLSEIGVINDFSNNPIGYNLSNKISRREMLKVMMNLAGKGQSETCEGYFKDLGPEDWGCYYAEKALELNYISPNEYFRPNDSISKIESLRMIFSAKEVQVEQTEDWRDGYLNKAVELGITETFGDFDTKALRGWIFVRADNTLIKVPNLAREVVFDKVTISFASAMDRDSVESSLNIYPEITTNLSWEDDKNLIVEIAQEIEDEIEVILNVASSAKDISGKKLGKTIVKKFKTSGIAKVDFISPEGEITDLTKNITVRFSKPMVSLTSLDNQGVCPITITPRLEGKCVWITTSTFQFRPTEGFPVGAKYKVMVPSGIQTISGDRTINFKNIEITTPKFEILTTPKKGYTDKPILITFNAPVDLNNFKENFEISGFSNSSLVIAYFKLPSSIEGEFDVKKNIVSILPSSGSWGYGKGYIYKLKAGLKSIRGNVNLGQETEMKFVTEKLLLSSSPFIYKDENLENKTLLTNLRQSQNESIITKNNPNILLKFYEEVDLNKLYFSLAYDFDIKYAKALEYIDSESIIKEDKKSIILEVKTSKDISNLNLNILTSRINKNSDDIKLTFNTKDYNKVLSYKFIDYKKACLTLKNSIGRNYDNIDKFNFGDEGGKVTYLNEINKYSRDTDCSYELGKNKYIVNTILNPETNYNLEIKKDLLDVDNYGLEYSYETSFTTLKAKNEDKIVSLVDPRDIILVPKDISPLGIAIRTANLDKVLVEVCEGDFEVTSLDYIKNSECVKKEVKINNLGFKVNFSVLNLEEIFSKKFSKGVVVLEVQKISTDKTEYELKDSYSRKSHLLRTDKSLVLKGQEDDNLLWLHDYSSGENLTDQILKIDRYSSKSDYSVFGKYLGRNRAFDGVVSFTASTDGLYNLSSKVDGYLLVTLKSGEEILLNTNNYYSNNNKEKTYLSTDKPIYKPGEKVRIKGVIRKEKATTYDLLTGYYDINIRDSRYQNIVSDKVLLSSNSTFTYEFDLDKETSLGNYIINVGSDSLSFAVEEYEKPDFKVETNSIKDYYLYGEAPKIDVSSEYYIGAPLAGGEGSYNISAVDYFFNGGKTTGYTWGDEPTFWWRSPMESSYKSSNNLESNKQFILNYEGNAKLEIDTSKTTKDKIYTVTSTIKDPNTKKSISSSSSFNLLNSDIFVGLKTNKYYYDFGDSVKLDFVTVDTEGNKLGNKNIVFKAYKVDYNYDKTTYNYDKKEELLLEKSLLTNSSGLSSIDFKIEDYGEFRFEIELGNKKYKTIKTIYVSGYNLIRPAEVEHNISIVSDKDKYDVGDTAEFIIQSPETGIKALVTVEKFDKVLYKKVIDIDSLSTIFTLPIKKEYLPNFELKAFIIKNTSVSEEVLEELKTLRIEMIDLEEELYSGREDIIIPLYVCYDIAYKGGIIPPIFSEELDKDLLIKLAALRVKEQELMQKLLPSYYLGSIPVKVSYDSVKLNSVAKTDKQNYLPSDKTVITLDIKDNAGNPVSGEALISVVDESLLALKNNSSDIVEFFYSEKRNDVRMSFNMQNLIKRFEFREEEFLNSFGGRGGGGEEMMMKSFNTMDSISSDMVMEEGISMPKALGAESSGMDNATKIRTEFKDLAYYKAVVNIVNGKAIITVPKLPDNLTTWVVKGYTVTKDTKVGNFESKFKVKKDLNLLPSVPRFFVSGDELEITANAINNTSKSLDLTSTLDITNASILSKPGNITIPANSTKLLTWKVKIDGMKNDINWDKYTSNLKLEVRSGNLVDALVLERKIISYGTAEYTFTNGFTYDLSYEEKINLPKSVDQTQGQIDISLGATILTNLLDSIDSIASMPGNNFYNTISALKKAAVLKSLYQKAGELEIYKNIEVVDYNGDTHKLDDIVLERIKDFNSYQNTDGGMMMYEDCVPRYFIKTCSNFRLTGEFLSTIKDLKEASYIIDDNIVNKALSYYKKELENQIKDYENRGNTYRNVDSFYKIIGYDKEFIKKYLLSSRFVNTTYSFDNISKLKIILLLQEVDSSNSLIQTYLHELKNKTIIEARGTLVPAHSWRGDNLLSTTLALRVFIDSGDKEKLIIENLARWVLAQKRESGDFGNSFTTAEVIKTITDYIDYTKELEGVSFEAKGYLNSKEIISETFDKNNKFSLKQDSFKLSDYLNFGVDNSLGFEKTGSGKLYYDVGLRYFLPIEEIEPRDEGIIVKRDYYAYNEYKEAFKEECISPFWFADYYYSFMPRRYCSKIKVKNIDNVSSGNKGDLLVGEIEIIVPSERNNVIVNNFIPAGAEIVNTNLDTTLEDISDITGDNNNSWYRGFSHTEIRDDKLVLFADKLYAGTYKYTYVIKLNHKGKYHHRSARAEELKKPEIWGRTKGEFFEIK